jgi:hypothetical protein
MRATAACFPCAGLALRLRDLYRWEHGLEPWEEGQSGKVLEWIGQRETRWETLAGVDYGTVMVQGREFEPFDSDGINTLLAPDRLLYGAGYGRGLAPTFYWRGSTTDARSWGSPCTTWGGSWCAISRPFPPSPRAGRS